MKRKFTKLLAVLALLTCGAATLTCCMNKGSDSSPTESESSQGESTSSTQGNSSSSNSSSSGGDAGDIRAFWIEVDYEEVDLFVGEEFTVTAELYKGTTLIEDAVFEWRSENSNIATVSDGTITVTGVGVCDIVVSAAAYEGVQTEITVSGKAPLALDVSAQTVELALEAMEGYDTTAEVTFDAKYQGASVPGATVTATPDNDNVSVAVEDDKIVLTANKVGETVVSVRYDYTNGMFVITNIRVQVVKPLVQTDETYLLSTGKKNDIDLSLINAAAGIDAEEVVKVYTNEAEFPIVGKEGTVVTVSNTESLGSDGSIAQTVIIETGNARLAVEMKGYTHVIRTAADFDYMKNFLEDTTIDANQTQSGLTKTKQIRGTYILANDIDFATEYPNGYSSPFSYADVGYQNRGWGHGWNATFDGNGHVISNLKLIKSTVAAGKWDCSLFGLIAADAIIKDVAFKNCSLDQELVTSAFFANVIYGKVENVYLEVADNNTTHQSKHGNSLFIGYGGKNAGLTVSSATGKPYAETKISNVTIVATGTMSEGDYVLKGAVGSLEEITGSIVVIGAEESKLCFMEDNTVGTGNTAYDTLAELQAINANIKAYSNFVSAAQDTELTACGSTGFANNGVSFTMTWNGNVIYENNAGNS